jgi:hypothetical protein
MMTSFDVQDLIKFVEALRTKLPDFEPSLVAQFERDTTQWLSTVNAVLTGLYAAEKDEQVLRSMQLIGTFLQRSQSSTQADEEPEKYSSMEIDQHEQAVPPFGNEVADVVPPNGDKVDHLWKQLTPNQVDLPTDPKEQEIELSRWYSWKIAHAADVGEMQSYIERWQTWKKPPASGDIVVYVENPALSGSPPVWIGQVDLFSLFVQGGMSPSAQVWLSFAETANPVGTEQYLWYQKHPDTVPLLHRWHDLNCWTVLAPEAHVFVTGSMRGILSKADKAAVLPEENSPTRDTRKGDWLFSSTSFSLFSASSSSACKSDMS